MGIFDKLKGKKEEEAKAVKASAAAKTVKKTSDKSEKPVLTETKPAVVKAEAKKELKGKSLQAHLVIIKPLVTEKAAHLAALNKYVFSINPKMNKIEVKKAIRSIYHVEPLSVNLANCGGKNVRYGRSHGKTRNWKKAIVTLKAGDKIEIYEGV
ncbi:MAG: 50S ribosomal protein L23 [Candidatus Buchananbacteria bacterium]